MDDIPLYHNNDFVAINIKPTKPNEKYFCNYFMRSLFVRNKEDQEYICTFCNILYYPKHQPVKKESTFDLPGPETDSQGNVIGDNMPLIAMIDDPNKNLSSTSYKQQKLPAAYEAQKKSGFKFINYEER
jgi:hypothetical protein